MDMLTPVFNFVHAHPYITIAIALYLVLCLVVVLAESGRSRGRSSSGRSSIRSYTSSMAQTATDAKTQMRHRSDAYLHNVHNTIRRKS